jgi:hypothetical protein
VMMPLPARKIPFITFLSIIKAPVIHALCSSRQRDIAGASSHSLSPGCGCGTCQQTICKRAYFSNRE